MIRISFALGFDNGVWTGPAMPNSVSFGAKSVGELGFIDMLETQLGIKVPEVPSARRKLDYFDAVTEADDGKQFYSASMKRDPMAVVDQLSEIRDSLIEAGWNQKAKTSVRKADELAKIESVFKDQCGKADRLRKVLNALKPRTALDSLTEVLVFEPKENLSALWISILEEALPKLGVKVEFKFRLKESCAPAETNLEKVSNLRKTPAKPSEDDSVNLVTCRDPWESARLVTAYLAKLSKDEQSATVIIAPEKHCGILKATMLGYGIPFGGNHSETSYARPALQIVILALALAWEPKGPKIALALLTIEGSPVPSRLRHNLIRSLDESLGIGGEHWTKTLEEAVKSLIENSPEEREKFEREAKRVQDWFSAPTFAMKDGIPIEAFSQICDRAADWLNKKWQVSQALSYREAAGVCESLKNLAQRLGEAKVSSERLLHFLMDSVGSGVQAEKHLAEADGPVIVSSPDEILAPAETIIWCDFTASTVHGKPELVFSSDEIAALAKSGIHWPNAEQAAVGAAHAWHQPFLAAQKRLILVSQLLDADGEPETYHPVLGELLPKAIRQEWLSAIHVKSVERDLPLTKAFLKNLGAKEVAAEPHHFHARSEWTLKTDSMKLREAESASSLEKLLGCDVAYVLTYGARLQGEERSNFEYDNRIKGTIAHEVIAQVFPSGKAPSATEARKAANVIVERVIKNRAPQLYQTEMAAELNSLKEIIFRSVQSYAEFLAQNGLAIEAAEINVEKSSKKLAGVHLTGQIDHVLSDKHKNRYIIDHKWGGSKFREDSLASGKSLQLALYSRFLDKGNEPILGYHMIEEGKVLILNKQLKAATQVTGEEAHEVLAAAEDQLKTKLAVIKSGKLTAQGHLDLGGEEKFAAPCKFCDFKQVCGLAWKAAA